MEAGHLESVATVGLDEVAGFARDFRGSDDHAIVTVGAQATAEGITVRAGFVTDFEEPTRMCGAEFLEEFEDIVVGAADRAVGAHFGRIGRGQADGDGIAVDIQADKERGLSGKWETGADGGADLGPRGLWLDREEGTEYVSFHGVCFPFY